MKLDYYAATGAFTLEVARTEKTKIDELMQEHGFDFSSPASTALTAKLFTKEPYAAAAFANVATPAAYTQLGRIIHEVEASWAKVGSSHIKVPADKELWPFQVADVEYALRRNNCLVGDQPGLGKTEVAIALANEIDAKRILVICPANVRIQWCRRIREWSTMRWPYVVYPILKGGHGVHPQAHWTVVSYDLARTEAIWKALAKLSYDLIVWDEIRYVKEIDSLRSRMSFGGGDKPIADAISSRGGYLLGLDGTPMPNRPREMYNVARHFCWDSIDFMSEEKFTKRFNPSMRVEIVGEDGRTKFYVDERSGRHAELQMRLRANFMVRHLKRDVMTQLKMPVYDLIYLDETGPVKAALQAESLLDIDPELLEGCDAETLGHVSVVRKLMGIAMAPQVADHLDFLLDSGEEKLVVFAWHIEVLNILERALQKWGVLRIDGSTSATRKQKLVDLFISDPRRHVIIGNMLSMGSGTDGLQQVAWHALIAEPDWVPGNNIQAFDRLDRGGQERTVQGDIFVVPGSFAEKVLASALRKLQTTDKALDRRVA